MLQSFRNANPIVKAAIIAGVFTILAAIIAGSFQLVKQQQSYQLVPIAIVQPTPSTPSSSSKIITVFGTEQEGVYFTAQTSGTYQISIVDGAYSTYPGPHWKSEIRIYKNKSIQWGVLPGDKDLEPVGFDTRFGDGTERSENDALLIAKSGSISINLNSGDWLLFVPADVKDMYFDNSGQVKISIVLT